MRNSPKERGHRLFEMLEAHLFMSVTVSPGYQNDTQSIQNAINSVGAGGTVQLTAGTFQVSSSLNLDGRTLAGVPGKTVLQWTGGSNSFLAASGSNSSVTGVTFDGAGLQITDNSQNVTVNNDTFENIGGTGVDCEGGSNNLQITQNTLQNVGGYGMVLYSINQAHVDNNTITNAYEGIHSVNFLGTAAGNNCTFNYNTITGISRIAIEVQNNWDNLSIGWNYVADFNLQPGGNSHIALSIATGPGTGGAIAQNVDVHDNVILGTGPGVPSDPNYLFTAIEIMGNASIVNHNYIANWGWGVLDGWSSNWQVTNNTFVGVTSQNGQDAVPESHGVSPSVDSGNTWVNSWDGTVPSSFAISAPSSTSTGAASNANTGSIGSSGNTSTSSNNGWSVTPTPPAKSTPTPATAKPAKPSGSGNSSSSSSSSSTLRQTMLGQR